MREKYHFIGIGGIGMSALARILLDRGAMVSGSDQKGSMLTQTLSAQGADVVVGHSEGHVFGDQAVVYSTNVKEENVEFCKAKTLGCPLLHRSDLLLELMQGYQAITVTGTHGKTTTSSLLAWVLLQAGCDPAFALGGIVSSLQRNGRHGEGKYFVAEADESDGSFLKYASHGAIITNVEADHLDYYQTVERMEEAYTQFINKVACKELLLWCGDDPYLQRYQREGISYGFSSHNRARIASYHQEGFCTIFDAHFEGKEYRQIKIPLPGKHTALNGIAVWMMALRLGVEEEKIRQAFLTFPGVARRCEVKAKVRQVLVLDDYAHHPTEVKTTLSAIRKAIGERRLIVVFQPHRYTRLAACLEEFGHAFEEADHLYLTDVYSAGEKAIEGVNTSTLITLLKKNFKKPLYHVARHQLLPVLQPLLRPHDVLVTMGAGDITFLSDELKSALEMHPPKKWKVALLCGGQSSEHEISLRSCCFFRDFLDQDLYEVELFGVTKEGGWIEGEDVIERLNAQESGQGIDFKVLQKVMQCDVVIPVFHGPNGEDGLYAALFQLFQKPFVGCDFRSASLAMNKAYMKRLVHSYGIPTPPFVDFFESDWRQNPQKWIQEIVNTLQFPLFVKPANIGSSIALTKVEKSEQIALAVERVLEKDHHVVVEQGVAGRDLEFALLGNQRVVVPPAGEILIDGGVYDYEAKYGKQAAPTTAYAQLSCELHEKGAEFARRAFLALGCKGLARFDLFLDAKENYWLHDTNPFPGCTSNSLYPLIFKSHGLSHSQLIDQLVILALEAHRRREGR